MSSRVLTGCAVILIGIAVGAGIPSAVAASGRPPVTPVVLPEDHGAHPGFEVEWWYTAGTVAAATGRQYFYFATIWSGARELVAKVNVVDLAGERTVVSEEYTDRTVPGRGQTAFDINGFELGWAPVSALGVWSVDAPVPNGDRLQLTLTPSHPYVLNGLDGIVRQGPAALSDYYSEPRLTVDGTLTAGGEIEPVTGEGWFDHQWGNFALDPGSLHWNWFACQLDDGGDLMLYQFITRAGIPTGVQDSTYVSPAGTVSHPRYQALALAPSITPAGATGVYPLRWHLQVPADGLELTLRARDLDGFIANSLVPSFWEGPTTVTSGTPGTCIVESTRESLLSGL
jgi:predicted secreted hydrolase